MESKWHLEASSKAEVESTWHLECNLSAQVRPTGHQVSLTGHKWVQLARRASLRLSRGRTL